MPRPIISLAVKIKRLLTIYPDLRDDWQYVLALIWKEQIGEQNHSASAYAFLGMVARHEVVDSESVRRGWQKVLEENPSLRGPGYGRRHKSLATEYKQIIKEIGKKVSPQQSMDL